MWYTAHAFDISQSTPPDLAGAFTPIASLEADLVRHLARRPALRKRVKALPALVHGAASPSLETIVRIGDDLGRVLAMLGSEGSMTLAKSSGDTLAGLETWNALVFAWQPLCGDKGGADCARFKVPASDADEPAPSGTCAGKPVWPVAVSLGPFSATVRPAGGNANGTQWRLDASGRRAAVDARRMTRHVVDAMLARTTPWQCLAEAADCVAGQCLVDCDALEKSIESLAARQGAHAGVVCRRAVRAAVREALDGLDDARFETNELQFFGHAGIAPGRLGADDFATQLEKAPAQRDGAWAGWFFSSKKNGPGAWEGTRLKSQ